MGERIFKGTAEVNGRVGPVTYKLANTSELTNDKAELDRLFSSHLNKQVVKVYDSDLPTNYGNPDALGNMQGLPAHLLAPVVNPEAKANPSNIPPREASMPPANAPTGSNAIPASIPAPPESPARAEPVSMPVAEEAPDADQPR